MSVEVRNLTRRPLEGQGRVFSRVAREILRDWEVSLVFVGPKRAQELNQALRNKDYIPNVLSYEVGDRSGEIIICPSAAARQAPSYNLQPTTYNLLLFIHGCLHLAKWKHGVKMEAREQELLERYAGSRRALTNVTTHSNRNRHRHLSDKGGRRRGDNR